MTPQPTTRRRAIASGVLGVVTAGVQYSLSLHFSREPTDSGLSGIGQAFGRFVIVLAVTLVCLCIDAAVLRLRYWAAIGLAAFFAQGVVFLELRAIFRQLGWGSNVVPIILLELSLVAIVAAMGCTAPTKPLQ